MVKIGYFNSLFILKTLFTTGKNGKWVTKFN